MRSFQRQISYRAATLAGLATNFFWGLLRVALMTALYKTQVEVAGFSLRDAITFTGLTQALIGFLAAFRWNELMDSVYTGEIAGDLLKPVDLYTQWMARDLGRAIAQLLTRGLTMMAAYALLVGISLPQTLGHWGAVVVALGLAWWVSFSWRFLANLAAFWTPNALGIVRMVFFISLFFAGFLMPLAFFPEWVQQAVYFTPFPHTVNTVVEVFLGVAQGPALLIAFAWQVIWGLALFLAGQLVLSAGVKRLVILGG
jgi:ABC-2 type transport system permease protein